MYCLDKRLIDYLVDTIEKMVGVLEEEIRTLLSSDFFSATERATVDELLVLLGDRQKRAHHNRDILYQERDRALALRADIMQQYPLIDKRTDAEIFEWFDCEIDRVASA